MSGIAFSARTIRRCSDPNSLGCVEEAEPKKQRCYQCWLRAQPPVIRSEAAKRRLALVPERWRYEKINKRDWPEGKRWCADCQSFILLVDCSGARCKACTSSANHKRAVASRFGIDEDTYTWLLTKQLGRCAICRQRPKSVRMAIDHDHNHRPCKGKGCPECVRGLLCVKCNHELLGAAHDSIHILRNAVVYLERPPMSDAWTIPDIEREQWEAKYGPGSEPAPF